MSASPDDKPPARESQREYDQREYEKSGCYPENGKPYRIWALLGGLVLVVALLAGAAALLNFLLLPQA